MPASAEDLVNDLYFEAELPWGSGRKPFLLRKLSNMDVLNAGTLNNFLLISAEFQRALVSERDKAKAEATYEEQEQKNREFLHEIAKKAMVEPSFMGIYEAMRKRTDDLDCRNFLPRDFLIELYDTQISGIPAELKKNEP